MKGKSRVVVSVLLSVFLLCGAAAADVVYTTGNFQDGTGTLGIIRENTEPAFLSDFAPDVRVFSFLDGDETRVAVREYEYGRSDGIYIYDPETGWSDPINETWEKGSLKAINIYDIAVLGENLYAACYDSGNVVEVSTSDYKPTGRSYTYPTPDGFVAHGVKVLVLNGDIYALFILDEGDYFTYGKSKLVKLNNDLEAVATFDVGANAADMTAMSGKIAIAYLGGPYIAATEGGIDVFDTTTEEVTPLERSAGPGKGINSVCSDGKNALYYIELELSGTDVYSGNIEKSTLYKQGATTPIKELSTGYSSNYLVYDSEEKNVVAGSGGNILIFDDSETLEKTYPIANLYSLAAVKKASAPEPGGSGGGCNAGLMAFAALLLVLPLALRKKSR
jgi:Synergist-CTERM protein sorting domain-containing protein